MTGGKSDVIANTEDVGTQFVSEARKMHYGETQERSIRGQATADETQELLEEGISVLPLPIPAAIKGTIQWSASARAQLSINLSTDPSIPLSY